jgi:hypothetical protein
VVAFLVALHFQLEFLDLGSNLVVLRRQGLDALLEVFLAVIRPVESREQVLP